MKTIPPLENLDYNIATVKRDCVCPVCGVVHKNLIELAFLDSQCAPKINNYLVIVCNKCQKAHKPLE